MQVSEHKVVCIYDDVKGKSIFRGGRESFFFFQTGWVRAFEYLIFCILGLGSCFRVLSLWGCESFSFNSLDVVHI
jgi:hypothetical protein